MTDYKASQAAKASAAAALQAAFPHLVACGPKESSLTAAAKNMRIELARAFPGVKFSVKSSRYSGGDSIRVRWTDGPVCAQVDAIIDRYSAGSFDGMTDCYDYSRNAWTDAFGDAKYVFSDRDDSDKALASAIRYAAQYWGFEAPSIDDYRAGKCWSQQVGNDNVQGLIRSEAYRRTWALTKAPVAAVMVEADEVAA